MLAKNIRKWYNISKLIYKIKIKTNKFHYGRNKY